MRVLNARFLFLALLTGLFATSNAQKTLADIRAEAKWIKMIDDPNVNYYVAVKTYEDYWKTHTKPADPEDRLSEDEGDKDKEPAARPMTKEEKIYEAEMIYQMKRFETWMREEKPFVQDDGRILSQQERVAIWKKQQQSK